MTIAASEDAAAVSQPDAASAPMPGLSRMTRWRTQAGEIDRAQRMDGGSQRLRTRQNCTRLQTVSTWQPSQAAGAFGLTNLYTKFTVISLSAIIEGAWHV